MRSRTFQQCLTALENNDFESVEGLLQNLNMPATEPAAITLANEIRSRINEKRLAAAGHSHAIPKTAYSIDAMPQKILGGLANNKKSSIDTMLFNSNSQRAKVSAAANDVITPSCYESLLTELDVQPPQPGVSLVAGCMNREENLLKVIGSWLETEASEIVIVDWSSESELWPKLAEISDPRLKVIRIDNEKHWVAAHALNVGLRFASHELVFRIDCDIELSKDFLKVNSPQRGELVRGFWKSGLAHGGEGQQFIQGTFGAFKTDLREANYYDERILTYGWEDSELYLRLTHDLGLAAKQIDARSLRHIEQSEKQRLENQDVKKNRFLGKFEPTEFEGAKNKFYTAFAGNWGSYFPSQDYAISPVQRQFYRGRRVTQSLKRNMDFERMAEVLAAKQLTAWASSTMPELANIDDAGIEFSTLLRDAHLANKSHDLIAALKSGRGVYFIRCEAGVCREALHKTLKVLRMHYPSFTLSLFLIESSFDGISSGAGGAPENIFMASGELIEKLSVLARAKEIRNIGDIEQSLETGNRNAGYLSISSSSLVDEIIGKAEKFSTDLANEYTVLAKSISASCFVTSLYDEQNLIRLIEYVACVVENLKVFERIVIYYEAANGLLAKILHEISERLTILPGRLLLVPYQKRPTFEELFSIKALLPPKSIIAIANADIVFDASFSKIEQVDLTRNIVVLSRRDISRDGSNARLIRIENGLPNTFSQDAWIFSNPFEPDFFLDYPIGTMHCDSFINHQISTSCRYNVINPCIDIKVFHLHDNRFNSSAEKQHRDFEIIKKSYNHERERNGGADPVKGVAWSTLANAAIIPSSIQFQHWAPKVAVVHFENCAEITFSHFVILHFLCDTIRLIKDAVVLIKLRKKHLQGAIGLLLARYQTHFLHTNFLIDVDDDEFNGSKLSAAGTVMRAASFESMAEWIYKGSINYLNNNTCELLAWPADPRTKFLRCDIVGDISTELAVSLLNALRLHEGQPLTPLFDFFSGLPDYSAEKNLITPFMDPLSKTLPVKVGINVDFRKYPSVAFITSLFKGGEFLPGYLENVLAAAKKAGGEVIIIDANVDDVDAKVVNHFLETQPDARDYIDYIRLDHDPGLYACWQIGIQRAKADLVTNANIDDRRCPQHTARLVKLLNNHPEYAGACGSISCVTSDGTGSWFALYDNQIWFYREKINEIGFEDLYRINEQGNVISRDVMHCMPVWRKSLHERYGYFDEAFYGTSADWAFWLKCSEAGEKFIFDESAFGRYFLNPDSHNRRNDPEGLKELKIIKDFIGFEQKSFSKQ